MKREGGMRRECKSIGIYNIELAFLLQYKLHHSESECDGPVRCCSTQRETLLRKSLS